MTIDFDNLPIMDCLPPGTTRQERIAANRVLHPHGLRACADCLEISSHTNFYSWTDNNNRRLYKTRCKECDYTPKSKPAVHPVSYRRADLTDQIIATRRAPDGAAPAQISGWNRAIMKNGLRICNMCRIVKDAERFSRVKGGNKKGCHDCIPPEKRAISRKEFLATGGFRAAPTATASPHDEAYQRQVDRTPARDQRTWGELQDMLSNGYVKDNLNKPLLVPEDEDWSYDTRPVTDFCIRKLEAWIKYYHPTAELRTTTA